MNKFSNEVKATTVKRHITDGVSVADLSKELGVSTPTIYSWITSSRGAKRKNRTLRKTPKAMSKSPTEITMLKIPVTYRQLVAALAEFNR